MKKRSGSPRSTGPSVLLFVTGTRKNLRVRITYYSEGRGQDVDWPLRFGNSADPAGFYIPDPADQARSMHVVEVHAGEGILDNIDLSGHPQFTKVAIVLPDGRELVKDIPNDPIATVGTAVAAAPATTASVFTATKIKVVATAERSHPTNKSVCIHAVQVFTSDDAGKPAPGKFQRIVVGRCAPEDRETNDPARPGFFSEEIEVSADEKEITYRVVLNNGETAEAKLAGPLKPEIKKQGLVAAVVAAFEAGRKGTP